MLINPENVVFETENDIIDYVSKGIVPSRKNFEKVMSKVRIPDYEKIEGQVYISKNMFIKCDQETLDFALNRVYKNRVRNRNICIGSLALILIAGLLLGNKSDKKDKYDEDDDM